MAARYVLCTMIDEAAADTPWGGSGLWAQHSLLAMFHNEVFGGEKVFQLMARLAQQPDANRDLLELIYAALVLGFEGRYRVIDNGRAQLAAVRDRLAQILKQAARRPSGRARPTLAGAFGAAPRRVELAAVGRGDGVGGAGTRRGSPWLLVFARRALGPGVFADPVAAAGTAGSGALRSLHRNRGWRSSSKPTSRPGLWPFATRSTAAWSRCAETGCSKPEAPHWYRNARR